MKRIYEGQGLAWFFRTVFALAAFGAINLVGWIGWGLWLWMN